MHPRGALGAGRVAGGDGLAVVEQRGVDVGVRSERLEPADRGGEAALVGVALGRRQRFGDVRLEPRRRARLGRRRRRRPRLAGPLGAVRGRAGLGVVAGARPRAPAGAGLGPGPRPCRGRPGRATSRPRGRAGRPATGPTASPRDRDSGASADFSSARLTIAGSAGSRPGTIAASGCGRLVQHLRAESTCCESPLKACR